MREAAGYIVFCGHGPSRRFLLLRNARHGTWAFPKGHLEAGEAIKAGARRELLEETGIREIAEVAGFEEKLVYDVPAGDATAGTSRVPKTVHMFLAEVKDPAWTRSDEHDAGGWYPAAEVLTRLQHENLRALFRRALAFLAAVTRPS